jgi:signal transduction histidine kinase
MAVRGFTPMRRAVIAVGVSSLALVGGVFSLGVARHGVAYSFAGDGIGGAAALLGAGWAMVACGVAFGLWRPSSRFGWLCALAGVGWFLLEWNNPETDSSLAFTTGLALYLVGVPVVAHAVLAYPGGRLATVIERTAVAGAYAGVVFLLGILPALVFDPETQGCSQCPRNLLLVYDDAGAAKGLARVGVAFALVWFPALAALVLFTLARRSPAARRAHWPVLILGAAYLGLVTAWFAASLNRGFLTNGSLERQLWLAQAAALAGITLGVGFGWVRAWLARSEVARLVVDLAHSPPTGGLRGALARIVGDPDLVLAYVLDDSGRLVDAQGRQVELPADLERTNLVCDGQTVAVLAHAPGRLGDEQLVDEVTGAARLALENERLQADVRGRLEELRSSRARIVEMGDSERKRLERDLHDGAQQRLVGLALGIRLARSRLTRDVDPDVLARLDEAEAELRRATADLRELAHGIFPAVLADEGLGAAVDALAEDGRVEVRVREMPEIRFPLPVETAAYTVIVEAVKAARSAVEIAVRPSGSDLIVDVEAAALDGIDFLELEDRVGALDGRLAVEREDGRTTIRSEVPCAS